MITKVPAPYGYCPICSYPGVRRERRLNGNDRCGKDHVYPSVAALRSLSVLKEQVVVLTQQCVAYEREIEEAQEALDSVVGGYHDLHNKGADTLKNQVNRVLERLSKQDEDPA